MTSFSVMLRTHYDADNDGTVDASPLSDDNPQALGTAGAGTGTAASRADHVHPSPNRARGAYDAIVYIQDGEVIAEDAAGAEIDSGTAGTDDSTVISAAISYLPNDGVLLFAGEFSTVAPISVTKSIEIQANGAIFNAINSHGFFEFAGSADRTTLLTADVAAGDASVSVADGSGVVIGDLVIISDDVIWGPGAGYETWKTGEIQEVVAIDGNLITFSEKTLHTYTTLQNAFAILISPTTASVKGGTFLGDNRTGDAFGIEFNYCKNVIISDSTFCNVGDRGIDIKNSFNVTVKNVKVAGSARSGLGYGINFSNACAHVRVVDSDISDCRHCVNLGGISSEPGQVRNCTISGGSMRGGNITGAHTVAAHEIAEDLTVCGVCLEAVVGSSVKSGARRTRVLNCNMHGGGVAFRGVSTSNEFVLIGNTLDGISLDTSTGLLVSSSTVQNIKSLLINSNVCKNLKYGIVIGGNGSSVDFVDIKDNIFEMAVGSSDGIKIENCARGIITDNLVSNPGGAGVMVLNSAYLSINSNHLLNSNSSDSTLSGLMLYGVTHSEIINNYLVDVTPRQKYAIREYGASDFNTIEGCVLEGWVAAPMTLVGVDTIFKKNRGYLTENTGTSTGTGSEQTIAHGLGFTPTKQQVVLIAGSATANPYHSSAPDATNIYVTAGSGQEWGWNVP